MFAKEADEDTVQYADVTVMRRMLDGENAASIPRATNNRIAAAAESAVYASIDHTVLIAPRRPPPRFVNRE